MKKTNEMPKNQTGNHATVPKFMGKGPKYPFAFYVALVLSMTVGGIPVLAAGDPLAVINNHFYLFPDPGHRLDLIGIWCGAGRFELKEP